MPATANMRLETEAVAEFAKGGDLTARGSTRVEGDPVVGQMNDYSALVDRLFAEDNAADVRYAASTRERGGYVGIPEVTTLRRVEKIWNSVFSERQLIVGNYVIEARQRGVEEGYPASMLSDGERVGFYLIGQVLLADEKLIVIDEPELHIHESIQSSLWDSLEAARPDCTFVYITHDLTFAATRANAPKVVLHEYRGAQASFPKNVQPRPVLPDVNGPVWEWDLLPPGTGLPEDVVLRIAGSRRRTLLVEGRRGGLDEEIYAALFRQYHIVPSDGCAAVIRGVQAFRDHPGLHHYDVCGIIDRDDRDDLEISKLAGMRVFALPVAGVENLLLLPDVLTAFLDHIKIPSSEHSQLIMDGMGRAVQFLQRNRDGAITGRARYALERRLAWPELERKTRHEFVDATQQVIGEINPEAVYDNAAAAVDAVLMSESLADAYTRLLAIYRNKGLTAVVVSAFATKVTDYRRIVLGLLRDPGGPVAITIGAQLPTP
jgi:hypothetical protein